MGTCILATIKITHHSSMGSTIGQVEPSIEDNSSQVCAMAKASGKCYMETPIKVSTWTIKKMDKVYICGKMDPNTSVHFKTITGMVMVKCTGMMDDLIKVNGSMALKKMSPSSWIMASINHLQKLKILSIQSQSLQIKKRHQCQKDTIYPLFCRKSKQDQFQIQAQETLLKEWIHPLL